MSSNYTTYSESEIVKKLTLGSHFCYFYNNKYELVNFLIPYFKTGLENNEFCIWIISEDLTPDFAMNALREAVIDFDHYLEKGQMKILPYTKWYLKREVFNLEKVIEKATYYLNHALTNGYSGLRVTGDIRWLDKNDLDRFIDYEIYVNNSIGDYKMIAICTYPISKFNKFELLDIAKSHQFVLTKSNGSYKIIEYIDSKSIKKEKELIQSNIQNIQHLLNSIQGYAEVAMMKIKRDNPTYNYLKKINASAESASDLAKKMLRHK
ncbi:MAG: MEDS domain-containing protein [Candidatus Hodarchaeota archaeon]